MNGRRLNRISAKQVPGLGPGKYADGGGLYLRVPKGGRTRRWVFIWARNGKVREMGLGPFPDVTLARAREKAAAARVNIDGGLDPIELRKLVVVPMRRKFRDVAHEHHETKVVPAVTARTARTRWRVLELHGQLLYSKPVDEIQMTDVLSTLKPIWLKIPDTASRLRAQIEEVLDYARVTGLIDQAVANPARWKGNLEHVLPRQKSPDVHHAAMPWQDVPGFVAHLQTMNAVSSRCLELIILTATRSVEAREATWAEINFEEALWTIPAERMKMEREHRVPLSDRAVELLRNMERLRRSKFIFPGLIPGEPISDGAMRMMVGRIGLRGEVAIHGFRSTFRDWCAEKEMCPREVAEMALAHKVGSAVERAYLRTDLFDRRRALMESWSTYVTGATIAANVVAFRQR